ncbi:MAG: PSD1 and planctomycete cytochrome C domain-containing protein [Planctomycetota bacterium]
MRQREPRLSHAAVCLAPPPYAHPQESPMAGFFPAARLSMSTRARDQLAFLGMFIPLTLVGHNVSAVEPARGNGKHQAFFENQVRPLLLDKCVACHGADIAESDLRLDSRDRLLQGGISGTAAIAGDTETSRILRAVVGQGMERMPPEEPLTDREIAILKRWVRIGLPWTPDAMPGQDEPALGDQEAIGRVAASHWAFQAIQDPAVPNERWTHDEADVTNSIDAYVARRHREMGVQASAPADRRTLLRRLSVDLIGLPPSIQALADFVADPRTTSEVVAEQVDALLASQHHGERWARYWLDLARYADTRDWKAAAELRYPYAYTYRDYVIRSLNQDKPYDVFIKEQIAADRLHEQADSPELAALGFLTVGPQFGNNRLERIADKIDVVCRGLMGVTVSCARCHDHKYDPIPTEDYYSLYGVFASSQQPERYPLLSEDKIDLQGRKDFDSKLAAKQKDLLEYKENLRDEAVNALKDNLAKYLEGFYLLSVAKTKSIRGVISQLDIKETAMTPLDQILRARLMSEKDADHAVLAPWHQTLSASPAPSKKLIATWTQQWVADSRLNARLRELLELKAPTSPSELIQVYATLFDESMRSDEGSLQPVREVLFEARGWFDLDPERVANASRLFGKGRQELAKLDSAIMEVEASHPAAPPRAMTLVDLDRPVTPFVMLRGEPNRRGDRVPRRFLSVLSEETRQPFQTGSGRLDLAEAIVSTDNPLTARVLVNRVWAQYFGRGLVASLDDFGLRSAPPSHPELLDHLASGFMANQWSLKWLHRQITTSRTYLQSCGDPEKHDASAAVDPENRLLSRQNRRRLDLEAMRDAMLFAAGTLDPQIGGRSVKLSEAPYPKRRTLYAYVDRNELDLMLRTFDFAAPSASAADRPETTIPQQALFGMNHPMMVEISNAIAQRVEDPSSSSSVSDESVVQRLFQHVFGRDPSRRESELAKTFLSVAAQTPASRPVWEYGYGPIARTERSFESFAHWTGSEYQVGETFPDPILKHLRVASTAAHPGKDADQGVIRRWVAPADGTIRIRGFLKHARERSDGVLAIVRGDGVYETYNVNRSESRTDIDDVKVRSGQVIDFIGSPKASPSSDSYVWTVRIHGVSGDLNGKHWDSRADFAGPPAPAMRPLAQFAQALLLTNEFLYLD